MYCILIINELQRIVWANPITDSLKQLKSGVLDRGIFGIEDERGILRGFKRAILAGEMGNLPAGGLRVEAFDVALLTSFVAGLDIDLEQIFAEKPADQVAKFAARSDGRDEGDDPLGNKNLRHFRDPPDVFEAILVSEPQIGVQATAQVVSIQDDTHPALLVQNTLGGVGNGGLAGSRKAAEPNYESSLAKQNLFVVAAEKTVEFGMNVHEKISG